MSTQSSTIIERVWNYCNVLRELAPMFLRGDGISYGDCVERQLPVVWVGQLRQSVLKSAFEGRLARGIR